MTTLREAATQALEAMDKATRYMSFSDHRKLNEAITALKAALEQPHDCAECTKWQRAVLEQGEVIEQLKAALEQPDRAQRMRDAGYIRRPTLREMAALEQPEPDRPTIEQMMAVIGENQRLRAELKFGSIEPEQLEGS